MDKAAEKSAQCQYRRKYHFLPLAQWMNGPNGAIFYNNEYDVFFQYSRFCKRLAKKRSRV
ncbi:MAG: hypothetical protein ACTSRZ_14240 [Promethearchaeota archaeon]